jgi:carboxypeptidase D
MGIPSVRGLLVLALSWATTASAQSSADYYVHDLPGAPEFPRIKMHAG